MVMGFSRDPGPLPFMTIRDRVKWAPRLSNGMIEISGHHGFKMPQRMVRVVRYEPYDGPCPSELSAVYQGKKLIAVYLAELDG